MKTIERIKKDHRVSDAWDEGEDGYWVSLKDGWQNPAMDQHCHTIHEWKIADVIRQFRSITPCDCQQCKEELARHAKA